jgi:hypothetical protein
MKIVNTIAAEGDPDNVSSLGREILWKYREVL